MKVIVKHKKLKRLTRHEKVVQAVAREQMKHLRKVLENSVVFQDGEAAQWADNALEIFNAFDELPVLSSVKLDLVVGIGKDVLKWLRKA